MTFPFAGEWDRAIVHVRDGCGLVLRDFIHLDAVLGKPVLIASRPSFDSG